MLDTNAPPAVPGLPSVPDGQSPSPDAESLLPATATDALRSWLEAQRDAYATGAEVRTAEVRRAIRPACDEARRRGARVEQVIVLLKQLWATVPPAAAGGGQGAAWRGSGWRDDREALAGIVRVCIEEFYAEFDALSQAGAGRSVERASTEGFPPDGASSDGVTAPRSMPATPRAPLA